MEQRTRTNGASASGSSSAPRWTFILLLAWGLLGAWLTFAFAHGETFRDDGVALPALAFLMTSAVIGSRIYLYIQDRSQARARHDHAQVGRPLPSAS